MMTGSFRLLSVQLTAQPVSLDDIRLWRDLHRREMKCQIVHDTLHPRPGWTQSYRVEVNGAPAGYGSIVLGGPWTGTRTVFEFYILPPRRVLAFDLFESLLASSQATGMTVQTNDTLLNVMLHAWAHNIAAEKIIFEDGVTTACAAHSAALRRRGEPDNDWVLDLNGEVAAKGGILYHYNRPYGDIYMEVAEPFRRRGLGCYLVQELKRICYEGGSVPCARCNPDNIASRKTLQKAGLVPCALILNGIL
jgi:GNAT superfamily N-acetyltransferase